MKHRIEFNVLTHLDNFSIGISTSSQCEDEYGKCRLTTIGFFLFEIEIFSYKKDEFFNPYN